jgi:hypothetical protein
MSLTTTLRAAHRGVCRRGDRDGVNVQRGRDLGDRADVGTEHDEHDVCCNGREMSSRRCTALLSRARCS